MPFDRQFARMLLEICRYTYAAAFTDPQYRTEAEDALAKMRAHGAAEGIVPVLIRSGPTSVACVTSFDNCNVVAYMGTKTEFHSGLETLQSVEDWLENLRAAMVPYKLTLAQLGGKAAAGVNANALGGLVHAGFLEELGAVQTQVADAILAHGGRERPLYVTGHSQGGAEAALATRAFLAGGFNVAATYTFAAPRPGDQDFVDSVPASLPVYRLEFGDDVVPHVPPRLLNRLALTVFSEAVQHLPLSERAAKFVEFVKEQALLGYVGLGRLCYGNNTTEVLRVGLSADDEQDIFNERLRSLLVNPEHWGDHHHLAGTRAEVAAGKEGNYTALVSRFTLA